MKQARTIAVAAAVAAVTGVFALLFFLYLLQRAASPGRGQATGSGPRTAHLSAPARR